MGSTAALRALSALFPHGDCASKALGIAQSDELSGALTLAFSLLTVTGTGLEGQFDSRVPICANDENCRTAAEASFPSLAFPSPARWTLPTTPPLTPRWSRPCSSATSSTPTTRGVPGHRRRHLRPRYSRRRGFRLLYARL
ncbi:hypothetical protein M5E87_12700 [Flavonifractor plautii]|nr:hypothetical protein M5E87_12700 [Flavonifractor plautii]